MSKIVFDKFQEPLHFASNVDGTPAYAVGAWVEVFEDGDMSLIGYVENEQGEQLREEEDKSIDAMKE